jgi:poly-gamma-glutamate synthesis protein (capsule biosynthesis protein)
MSANLTRSIRLFLCGDVMTGRGIDQVLPHPGDPVLYESCVCDARDYVQLAESVNGPIPRPVDTAYPWGEAPDELRRAGTDATILNLETSVTTSAACWPGKGIHYRMHPRNIGCIAVVHPVCCCLANNHILDWGYEGLAETLGTLDEAGLPRTGAGLNAAEAGAPAVLSVAGQGRVLVFSFGSTTSGIPWKWAATGGRPGVNLLDDLSGRTARRIAADIRQARQPGDVVVASLHWGSNWGYSVPDEQVQFAHRLVEEGVDLVHGHSSHHVKALEVYRDRLILYGCGDFLTDYEGIEGHEEFRNDLALMYLVEVDSAQGRLVEARLVPMQVRRFRLNHAAPADVHWLCDLLNRQGARFGTRVESQEDRDLVVRWP